MNSNQRLFRRQFLVTEEKVKLFPDWNQNQFGTFTIHSHPDLEVTLAESKKSGLKFALLGFIIDPFSPHKTNNDLLLEISDQVDTINDLTGLLNNYSGRFVLLFSRHQDLFVFHDACGLRSVFYTRFNEKVYLGSQPTLLQEVVPIKKGKRFEDYLASDYSKNVGQDWIPAGSSLFEGVHQLVPNHYLQLSAYRQVRYWPTKPIENADFDQAVLDASVLLKNSLLAANKRQKLALSLTAGWDSRILLSASRDISDEIFYYTQFHFGMNRKTNDIRIPKKLSEHLDLSYRVIDCRKDVPDEFEAIYKRNTSFARLEGMDSWIKRVSGLIDSYPENHLRISGNCSEIARCFYYSSGTHGTITDEVQILNLIPGWSSLNFVRDNIHSWFKEAHDLSSKNNIDLLDLFYWEHRMGSWQAQHQLEWDIIHESFTPFNNRRLIEHMLGVNKRMRISPSYVFFEEIIKSLWPDVLTFPINPPPSKFTAFKNGLVQSLKNITSDFQAYKMARGIYRSIQKKV